MSGVKEKASASSSRGGEAKASRARRGRPPKSAASPARTSASQEAKRRAAAILDVLGGARLPGEAAAALGVSLPRYYLLEQQALAGLVQACEPRTRGGPRLETRLAELEKQLQKRERECLRQQALLRAAQRAVGLAPPSPSKPAVRENSGKTKGKRLRRRRRPTVRALKAAGALRDSSGPETPSALQPETVNPAWGAAPEAVKEATGDS